jgi:cell division protein FtsW
MTALARLWHSALGRIGVHRAVDFSTLGPQSSRVQPIDHALISVLFCLLAVGLIFVYSASIPLADHPENARLTPHHFALKHAFAIALALLMGVVAFQIPVSLWNRFAPLMFVLALFLLILVLLPFVGHSAKGARRWIPLGVMNFQPTEFMKLAAMLYAANYIARKQELKEMFVKGFLPVGFALGMAGALVLAQKDLGGFAVVVIVAMLVLFYGGINAKIFTAMIGVFAVTATFSILLYSYRFERVLAFINPFDPRYERGIGWQLTNSLIAFARGGVTGEGLGQSVEKLFYLPDAHTDFIIAVIAEELGLIGVVILVLAYWWVIWRAFSIGRQALVLDRAFAGLTALGIGTWLGVQTIINMGVALGLLPTKGLTLPFISYGGSSILMGILTMVLLLRIDYESRAMMTGRTI